MRLREPELRGHSSPATRGKDATEDVCMGYACCRGSTRGTGNSEGQLRKMTNLYAISFFKN